MTQPPTRQPGTAAAVVALAALTVIGWAITAYGQTSIPAGGDTLEIRPHEIHAAEIFYSNAGAQSSLPADGRLCLKDVCAHVKTSISIAAPLERLTVTPEDGHIAIPDQIDVPDGESVRVLILRPMF